MRLNNDQIDFIRFDLRERGITFEPLADCLVDHICCLFENETAGDFAGIHRKVIETLGGEQLIEIQHQTIFLLTLKKQIAMKKWMYLSLYLAVVCCTTGLLFKVMHWPMASILLVVGVVLLNFGFFPVYLIDKYKKAVSQ